MTPKKQDTPHVYVGESSVCLKCFKPKYSPAASHILSSPESIYDSSHPQDKPTVSLTHIHTCVLCSETRVCSSLCEPGVPVLHDNIYKTYTEMCSKCRVFGPMQSVDTDEEFITTSKQDAAATNTIQNAVQNDSNTSVNANANVNIKCEGHICPRCYETIFYDKKTCRKPHHPTSQQALCEKCAQQNDVLINRPNEVDFIEQTSSSVLTGAEVSENILKGEKTYWNVTHNTDGSLRDDWRILGNNHRLNIQQMIQRLKAQETGARKSHVDTVSESTAKLTPEERLQYERDARKKVSRSPDAPSSKSVINKESAEKEKQNKDYNKTIKQLIKDISNRRPGLSEEVLLKAAKKKYDVLYNILY